MNNNNLNCCTVRCVCAVGRPTGKAPSSYKIHYIGRDQPETTLEKLTELNTNWKYLASVCYQLYYILVMCFWQIQQQQQQCDKLTTFRAVTTTAN